MDNVLAGIPTTSTLLESMNSSEVLDGCDGSFYVLVVISYDRLIDANSCGNTGSGLSPTVPTVILHNVGQYLLMNK